MVNMISVNGVKKSQRQWAMTIGVSTAILLSERRKGTAEEYIADMLSGARKPKRPKLTWENACNIRKEYMANPDEKQESIAARYGVSRVTVNQVISGVIWKLKKQGSCLTVTPERH